MLKVANLSISIGPVAIIRNVSLNSQQASRADLSAATVLEKPR